jgi:hypothetical protein
MPTLADFVGTWYFRGYKTHPCSIRLHGPSAVWIRDEHAYEYTGRVDGATLYADRPGHPGFFGVITSDLKQIEWSNHEVWKR